MQAIERTGAHALPFGEHSGAEISGVDLSLPLDDATFETPVRGVDEATSFCVSAIRI